MNQFGKHLHALRQIKKISQRDLAAQVGIDFTYLSKIERGHLEPPSEVVIRQIAHVLDADEDTLINLAGKIPRNLKLVLQDNPLLTELLYVLSNQNVKDEVYRKMILIVREESLKGLICQK